MLFKVATVGRTEVIIKRLEPSGALSTKTVFIPPKTVLDVYGYAYAEEARRFIVWNEQVSAAFFTVGINECRPVD
ncbi:MAG: hypothetical protein PHG75_08605 [Syntrophomonas sp.]|nr:hypothetical protein [Syntrophomonas sp.]